jgi:hypothetical protein
MPRKGAGKGAMPTLVVGMLRRFPALLMPTTSVGMAPETQRDLLLLFGVLGMLAQPGAVFLDIQLLAAGLSTQRVVVIAGLFAHQKDDFRLFLALRHCVLLQRNSDGFKVLVSRGPIDIGRLELHIILKLAGFESDAEALFTAQNAKSRTRRDKITYFGWID